MSPTHHEDHSHLHLEKGEDKILLDHSYDGISELDNPLPSWWQFTFYGALVFAAFYFSFYTILGGPTLRDEFAKDYDIIQKKQAEIKAKNGGFNSEKYQQIVALDGIKKGEEVYLNNCLACHKEKGMGDIGPNLTDEHWLWAKGTPETIYPVIFNGVPQNGMPTWSETISSDEIYQVTAYLMTLKNTNIPGGKAPPGEKIEAH